MVTPPIVTAQLSRPLILAGNNQRVVYVLLEVSKPSTPSNQLALPREFRAALDVSGSTGERASAGSSESKLDVISEGMIKVVEGLGPTDVISLVGFDEDFHRIAETQSIALIKAKAIKQLQELRPGGMTKLSEALGHAVKANRVDRVVRAHVGSDGHINSGGSSERSRCIKIMQDPQAVPTFVLGLGVDSDEKFLQELANAGPTGSFYMYVSDAFAYADALQKQLALLVSMGDYRNVVISATTANGVKLVKATRMVPTQEEIGAGANYVDYQHGDLDALGQKILLQLEVPAQDFYAQAGFVDQMHQILEWSVSFATPQGSDKVNGIVEAEITGSEAKFQQASLNQIVMTTVYTASGAAYTLLGDYQQAATMYTMAGHTQIAQGLQTLSGGSMDDTDAKRTLMTQIRTSGSGLDTLSS